MAKEPTQDKARGKTAKTPKPVATATAEPKKFDRKAEEAKLVAKYPKRQIVAGSLKDSGELEEFGQKRSIEIKCAATGKKFRIATSDLHQVEFHPDHMRELRLQRRKELRAAKKKGKKPTAPKAAKPTAKAAKSGKPAKRATRTTAKPPAPVEAVAAGEDAVVATADMGATA